MTRQAPALRVFWTLGGLAAWFVAGCRGESAVVATSGGSMAEASARGVVVTRSSAQNPRPEDSGVRSLPRPGDERAEDAGCPRDPYTPESYASPCEQPPATPNCTGGWCTIRPGCFFMGSPWCEWGRARDTANPVQVTLTHRFRIQRLELTQREWKAQGLPNPSQATPDGGGDCADDDCPVGNVNWFEALAFANLLSKREGEPECYVLDKCTGTLGQGLVCEAVRNSGHSMYDCPGYRLPTEAEWEYAARAGTKTSVYSGAGAKGAALTACFDDPVLSPIAWYCANGGQRTHPAGLKEPNRWGLHDMIGNAGEWVASRYGLNGGGPYVDWGAVLDSRGKDMVQLRGGGWNLWPSMLRVSAKMPVPPSMRGPGTGFRLVQTTPR